MKPLKVVSFGYSNGIIEPAHIGVEDTGLAVFDCRNMPDPGGKGLGPNGKHEAVQAFMKDVLAGHFDDMRGDVVSKAADEHVSVLAFGDGGGLYRGAALAELMAKELTGTGEYEVELLHRDIDHPPSIAKATSKGSFHSYATPVGSDDDDGDDAFSGDDDDDTEEEDEDIFPESFKDAKAAFDAEKTGKNAADYLMEARDLDLDESEQREAFDEAVVDIAAWLKKLA